MFDFVIYVEFLCIRWKVVEAMLFLVFYYSMLLLHCNDYYYCDLKTTICKVSWILISSFDYKCFEELLKIELNCPWNCNVNMASHADFEHCQIIWHTQ